LHVEQGAGELVGGDTGGGSWHRLIFFEKVRHWIAPAADSAVLFVCPDEFSAALPALPNSFVFLLVKTWIRGDTKCGFT
jgi:hypothetical protein